MCKLHYEPQSAIGRVWNRLEGWEMCPFTTFANVETSISTAKFIWNFPLRPENNYLRAKKFWTPFLSLSCVQAVCKPQWECCLAIGRRIRRMRSVTVYKVQLEPVKNAILSPVKKFDWSFYRNYVFYQSKFNTDNWLWWYLQHRNVSKRLDLLKFIVYR